MPYANDRRKSAPEGDDESLSPEFLAMLVACGGEVRESDRAALAHADGERQHGRRKGDIAGRAPADNRRS